MQIQGQEISFTILSGTDRYNASHLFHFLVPLTAEVKIIFNTVNWLSRREEESREFVVRDDKA